MAKYSERSTCFECGSIVFRLVIMCLNFLFLDRIYAPLFIISTSRSNKRCRWAILSLSELIRSNNAFSTTFTPSWNANEASLNAVTCEHLLKKLASSAFARIKDVPWVDPVTNVRLYLTMFPNLVSKVCPLRCILNSHMKLIWSTILFFSWSISFYFLYSLYMSQILFRIR